MPRGNRSPLHSLLTCASLNIDNAMSHYRRNTSTQATTHTPTSTFTGWQRTCTQTHARSRIPVHLPKRMRLRANILLPMGLGEIQFQCAQWRVFGRQRAAQIVLKCARKKNTHIHKRTAMCSAMDGSSVVANSSVATGRVSTERELSASCYWPLDVANMLSNIANCIYNSTRFQWIYRTSISVGNLTISRRCICSVVHIGKSNYCFDSITWREAPTSTAAHTDTDEFHI